MPDDNQEKYNVGGETMREVFNPIGMTNLSDLQAVLDRLEIVLSLAVMRETAMQTEAARREVTIQELLVSKARLHTNLRDSWYAMCAMRNDINQHIPMPSIEADLLESPETSVFCSAVAHAVITKLNESKS
jgi:hypothetical protein